MSDEEFSFKIVDYEPRDDAPPDNRVWLLTGDSWRVWRDGNVYMMQYQSGELQGNLRAIAIEEDDFAGLRDGTSTRTSVLRRHHAS